MRLRPASFAVPLVVVIACWFVLRAQQQPAPASNVVQIPADPTPVDTTEVPDIAGQISLRSEHLKPMIEEVHPADWVAKGAPEAYIGQWNSLIQQNQAIQTDMTAIAQRPDAMEDVLRALFRVHRFDSDLAGLLASVRRYQNPALADLIESVAVGDQRPVDKLQQFVLGLASEKERLLDVEDKEAQRCRASLAGQPPVRSAAPRKTTSGTSK